MAMQLPSEDEGGEMSEINVTPLVDVMLVLLVVFIVTAPLLTQVVKVKLPKTEQTEPTPDKHVAILAVTASGEAMLDDKQVPLPKLESELKALQERDPDISVQLQADRAAVFESVAKVMASAQRSGVSKLSFVTVEQ
ncbi:ExbD/TolR family protein [Methylicorpusculum sp.]|uniref:ExbD/TolR family protein n=1 Tax=Methylicorpusculum sp. TaxID=2713644 RepID=UPI0027318182|nr:biopolymer transporter ExbD [Methylicorpusculum sp.]MDP2180224.1 biopolymer transporter ExbD [Methylicorpusculum sp.]MDP3528233.1 biopolymer transporter ExbD [Methylicorpusculum sp.]MDZ4150518.1 biopolymer transporter ExbD [Methylicorpusculum sp.]